MKPQPIACNARNASHVVESPADKLRLRRELSTTLMGLAGLDALSLEQLQRKVILIGAALDDALAHLDRLTPHLAPLAASRCRSKLEQQASIVHLCLEMVAFAVTGIASRLRATNAQDVAVRRRLRSMSGLLGEKTQLLVTRWLKQAAPGDAQDGRGVDADADADANTAGPFHQMLAQIEPHLDASVFARLRRAIAPCCPPAKISDPGARNGPAQPPASTPHGTRGHIES